MKKAAHRKSPPKQRRKDGARRKSPAWAAAAQPRSGHASGAARRSGGATPARHGGRPASSRPRSSLAIPLSLFDAATARGSSVAIAVAGRYSREDREAFALLLMPFLLLAAMIAVSSGVRLDRAVEPIFAGRDQPITEPQHMPPRPTTVVRPVAPSVEVRDVGGATDAVAAAISPPRSVAASSHPGLPLEVRSAQIERELAAATPPDAGATSAPPTLARPAVSRSVAAHASPVETAEPAPPQDLALAAIPGDRTAMLDLSSVENLPPTSGGQPLVSARTEPSAGDDPRCSIEAAAAAFRSGFPAPDFGAAASGAEFGLRLSAAALRQLDSFTIYDDAYRRISYPMGDVDGLYGVCTDVVIRAYRDLGVDLQVAVQKSRVGSGDTNIDHRRTETLRRFFQRAGESLPVSTFAEDYAPGDIVTYDRPQNSGSRSHIAIVTDVIGPTGAPMIVHNRGWGAQLEDALFVDRITGHYRYAAPPVDPSPVAGAAKSPSAGKGKPLLRPAKSRRFETAGPPRQAAPGRSTGSPRRAADTASAVTEANLTGRPAAGAIRR